MSSEVEAAASQGDVFRLSMISNVLSDVSSGTAEELAEKAATYIPERMDQAKLTGWSVAWGPMVFKNNNVEAGGPDLVAYVANKSDTYVVAIAGTHKDSKRAQEVYDIKVQKSVDFEAWRNQSGAVTSRPNAVEPATPNTANIAEGTALGVWDLARTKTTLGPSSGTNILTYLQSLKPGSKVIYTGHSLGGALSPTIALGLLKELKNINPKNVSTLPTAGPAPGDAKFVGLFTDAFPANGGFNKNIINTRDPVTFAWSVDTRNYPKRSMQYLFDLFGKINPLSLLGGALLYFVKLAQGAQTKGGMTYTFLPSDSFTGTNKVKYEPPKTIDEYLDNAHVTHVNDYLTKWGINPGELGDISVALPLPFGPALAELKGEEGAFDNDGNYIGSKDAANTNEKATDGNSEL